MRSTQIALLLSTAILSGLLALNLRAQFRTQEKLDALAAAMAEPPQPLAPPMPAAMPAILAAEKAPEPRECDGRPLPQYIIEPPDVLLIEAALKDPKTGVTDRLPKQPISGSFVVRPDGTVGLGVWGSAVVTGLTLDRATAAIREQLLKSKSPEITAENLVVIVDVAAYNSKCFYIITDDGNGGDKVLRMPLTGNETIVDAIAKVDGLAEVASEIGSIAIVDGQPEFAGKKSIRLARKSADGTWQVLPVNWIAITQRGVATTNYQILNADRLYVTKAGK
jgi:polysaccharide biosynthesis/export protein